MATQAQLDLYAGALQAEALGGGAVQDADREAAGRTRNDYDRDLRNAVHVLVSIPQQINAMNAEVTVLQGSNPAGAARDTIINDAKAAQEALAEMLRNEQRLANLEAQAATFQSQQTQAQLALNQHLSSTRKTTPDMTQFLAAVHT